MSSFVFKQFTLSQQNSAMKIGTDSVVLGCLTEINQAKNILDIGTGTGVLALMMAQRSQAIIDAVEVDEAAANEAQVNFNNSPWQKRIKLHHTSIQQFAKSNKTSYDLIIANPPYFEAEKNYHIQNNQRQTARQNQTLTFTELVNCAAKLLKPNGFFWLILPTPETNQFLVAAKGVLFAHQHINMIPKPNKPANRIILALGLQPAPCVKSSFEVYNTDGTPSIAYKTVAQAFYTGKQFEL